MKYFSAAALSIGALGLSDRAEAGKLFSGQYGDGNTWNVYEAINNGLSFEDALSYANNAPNPTGGAATGHLVALTSAGENAFVNYNAPGDRWIGLTDRFGVAPGAQESQLFGSPGNQTMGWAWVNGDPFTYQNWNGGEPNNAGNGEDAGQMVNNGGWNDNGSGFDVDSPVPDLDSGGEGRPTFNYVIEWDTELAAKPTLPATRALPAALARVFPTPLARMPGPNGSASGFGVREVLDDKSDSNNYGPRDARNAISHLISNNDGTGLIFDGTASKIDLRDPFNSPNPTGVVQGGELPFLSSAGKTAEVNDVSTIIKGTFVVPAGQGGLYTFNGHSDDGFGLRILSQATPSSPLVQHKFQDAKNGTIDVDGSLVYMYGTGDSNTQGVINLAPGTYDVEFAAFEGGGGAYWELTTAKGDFVNNAYNVQAQWALLGSNASSAAVVGKAQPVVMTGPATVKNFAGNTGTIAATITNSRTATPAATGTVNDVILSIGTNASAVCCGRPANALPESMIHQFPISIPTQFGGTAATPTTSDFSTFVTGSFTVSAIDTDGVPGETLTFTLQSDDSSALRIVGQKFSTSSPGTADNNLSTLGNPEVTTAGDFNSDASVNGGDFLAWQRGNSPTPNSAADLATWKANYGGGADVYLLGGFEATGNANTYGTIRLMEGQTYAFEAWERQGGGDGGQEVWVANGSYTSFDPLAFFPLSTSTLAAGSKAANTGLALVNGPGTGPTGGLAAVPEPATLSLAFACAGMFAACAYRRK